MGTKPFACPLFLVCRKKGFSLPERLWVQEGRFKQLLIRRAREYRNTGKAVKNRRINCTATGKWPDSSTGDAHSNLILVPTQELGPLQVEDCNFRLSTSMWTLDWLEQDGWWLKFLEHYPVTSSKTNQKEVTNPAALTPDFAVKNHSLETIGEFRFSEPQGAWFSLYGCTINLSLLQTLRFCLASLWQQTWVWQHLQWAPVWLSVTFKTTFVNVIFLLCCQIQRTFLCPYLTSQKHLRRQLAFSSLQ